VLKAEDVQRIARNGQPYKSNGGELTVEEIVRLTTTDDWDGTLYELHFEPASQIAAQYNADHPDPHRMLPATSKRKGQHGRRRPQALVGEVVG